MSVSEELAGDLTQTYLREALPDFEVCSRRAVECILGMPTRCPMDFRLLPRLSNQASVICIIQSGNGRYAVSLSLGVNKTDYPELLPAKRDDDEVTDAIGEITNVIAGNFLGRPAFTHRFGAMLPSPPLFTLSGTSIQKGWCIQGLLVVNTAKIFLGFMIQATQKENPR